MTVRPTPSNAYVDAFNEAAATPQEKTARLIHAKQKPLLELASPGMLRLFDVLYLRHPRRINRLRRDLTWAYHEARKMGLLS